MDCLVLKIKNKHAEINTFKPAAMANAVHLGETEINISNDYLSTYAPFITEGRVSLLDGSVEVPIKILRDTGAVDSFILESILPFSSQSETGENMLVRGMGLNTLSVPLHKVKLHSDLVTGEVVIGLRPILPIEGVHLILGNKLAGDRVWPNVPSSPMVLSEGDVIQAVTKGVPVTVVTRSMTKNAECVLTDEAKRVSKAVSLAIPDLSDLSFPFSTDEWSREQHSDSSLAELFTLVLSDSDVHDVARGIVCSGRTLVENLESSWRGFCW